MVMVCILTETLCSRSVKWEREGSPIDWDNSIDGALRVTKVEPSQAGAYSCSVMGPHGEIAKRELQLVVSSKLDIQLKKK